MSTVSVGVMRRSGLALVAAVPLLVAACRGEREASSPLPAQIHNMQLAATHEGDEATQVLESLHGRPVGSEQSWVGIYGPMDMATAVYVSRFGTADDAASEMEAMVARIDSGATGFGHHTYFERSGRMVHSVFGQGQVNYFYQQDDELWWLGAHPMIARMAVAELLGLLPDSIPELGMRTPTAPDDLDR